MQHDFADVYEHNLVPVWRYVRARTGDEVEAEELTAEVFFQALRSWDRYDPARGTAGAWLVGIARHVLADRWRRRDPAPPAGPAHVEDPADAVVRSEALRELHRHLAALSERERDALALRFAAGLRAAEVGQALGVSEAAAKMLVHRAVVKLRGVMPRE